MIKNNLKLVKRDWDKLTDKTVAKASLVRDEMMVSLIQLSKEQIQGKRGSHTGPRGGKVWDKATPGQPPMNRTGDLRRSIRGEKYSSGFGTYSAIVGPTISYGRAVEMGGEFAPPSWRNSDAIKGFPYMEPAMRNFQTVVYPQIVSKYYGNGVS